VFGRLSAFDSALVAFPQIEAQEAEADQEGRAGFRNEGDIDEVDWPVEGNALPERGEYA
jgi:hypothetical protein